MKPEIQYSDFKVMIPNLEGDALAETITIKVPVTVCPDTGDEMLTEEAFELIESTKARYMGLLLPDEIKAIRTRHDLSQREMSELLQAGEKSYTRWETGRARPSRLINVLLRAIDEGKVTVEWLRSQRTRNFSWSKAMGSCLPQNRSPLATILFLREEPPSLPLIESSYENLAAAA